MRWNYDDSKLPGNRKALDWYKKNGLHVMAATAAQEMSAMLPRNKSNFQPIKDFCQLTAEKKLDGILCTIWDDCSPHFETVWRGIYDFALFSWNYEDIKPETAHALFRHRFYSPDLEDDSSGFQDLLEAAAPYWETVFIKEGDRANYHKNFTLIGLPDAAKNGEWSLKYQQKLAGAANAVVQYSTIKNRIGKAQEFTHRNNYALRIMNQLNELMGYSASLMLLLEQYDKAQSSDKKASGFLIRKYVQGFTSLRSNLEAVFSETRMMGNPHGYQLDSNMHEHLANGTNNTDWMYMYELPMNKKILSWLSQQGI